MRKLVLAIGGCFVVSLASASASPLRIDEVVGLRVGDRANVRVHLALPSDAAEPMLLTLRGQGAALDVVRGRMLRADAVDPKAAELEFLVPIVARTAGAAVFSAHALYYRCAKSCEAIEVDVSRPLEVLGQTP